MDIFTQLILTLADQGFVSLDVEITPEKLREKSAEMQQSLNAGPETTIKAEKNTRREREKQIKEVNEKADKLEE